MLDVVGKRKWYVGASAVLVLVSIVALIYPGLKLGVDFVSGSSVTIDFTEPDPGTAALRDAVVAAGHSEAVVQRSTGNRYFVRTSELGATGIEPIIRELEARFKDRYAVVEVTTVGAAVAKDTVRTAILATVVGSLLVMLYIMYSFRTVPAAYRYAVAAVVPLIHDVVITMGAFAVIGELIGVEVNAIFVVGVLTLIGYTVNNTIVVFDRIRDNVRTAPARPFRQAVNLAINESLVRNVNVSVTTLLAVLALLLLGGSTMRDFLVILFVGLSVGLYSSTFVSAQILVAWESGELGRWLRFWRRRKAQPQAQQA